ncbi:hypothetical protein U9M48_044523 [Paspalum notatum var. saurae]|uniref:Single-stranded DNA-binding protein, mitochondrial n=1 Tax=Paspalum notatum var. saurae TaxID=547442 RepID=A0AAQ3XID5_PASNO
MRSDAPLQRQASQRSRAPSEGSAAASRLPLAVSHISTERRLCPRRRRSKTPAVPFLSLERYGSSSSPTTAPSLARYELQSPSPSGSSYSPPLALLRSIDSIMTHVRVGLLKGLRMVIEQHRISTAFCRQSRAWSTTVSLSDLDEKDDMNNDDPDSKREMQPQSVDPKNGWGFRGVHRAIICGKVGQVPVQKILRNGRTITVFTVGTGGMFDQRVIGPNDLPKPAQWHRIAVHNDQLGAYAVQKLVKNSAVYVEGDIETRVYNDSMNDQVKNIPEICVRRDGKIQLVKSGDNAANISLDELREGLF